MSLTPHTETGSENTDVAQIFDLCEFLEGDESFL